MFAPVFCMCTSKVLLLLEVLARARCFIHSRRLDSAFIQSVFLSVIISYDIL